LLLLFLLNDAHLILAHFLKKYLESFKSLVLKCDIPDSSALCNISGLSFWVQHKFVNCFSWVEL